MAHSAGGISRRCWCNGTAFEINVRNITDRPKIEVCANGQTAVDSSDSYN